MPLLTSAEFQQKLSRDSAVRIPASGEDLVRELVGALDTYHAENKRLDEAMIRDASASQKWSDAQLRALDDAEHVLYRMLDRYRAALYTDQGKADRVLVMQMTVGVQEAHQGVVEFAHTRNLLLYTPDRARLGKQATEELDADWTALRNGTGAVKLCAGANADRGNRELRALYARLLSRPHGRALLRSVLSVQDGKTWEVTHTLLPAFTLNLDYRSRVAENKQRLATLGAERKGFEDELAQVDDECRTIETTGRSTSIWPLNVTVDWLYGTDKKYSRLVGRREQLWAEIEDREHEIAQYSDEAVDDQYVTGEPQPGIASKNSGKSVVKIRCGLRDNVHRNYAGGDDSPPIPAPAFIVYGHELVHVVQHRFPGRCMFMPEKYEKGDPKHLYGNTTEHETIRALKKRRDPDKHIPFYENGLRDEHRITPRMYHTSTSAFDLGEYE